MQNTTLDAGVNWAAPAKAPQGAATKTTIIKRPGTATEGIEMKHPYADILIAIAEGKEIQFQTGNGTWLPQSVNATLYEIHQSQFGPGRYRIKPATININGVEVEGPVANGSYSLSIWRGMGERMNCHFTTPEARDAAYAALIKPFGEQA